MIARVHVDTSLRPNVDQTYILRIVYVGLPWSSQRSAMASILILRMCACSRQTHIRASVYECVHALLNRHAVVLMLWAYCFAGLVQQVSEVEKEHMETTVPALRRSARKVAEAIEECAEVSTLVEEWYVVPSACFSSLKYFFALASRHTTSERPQCIPRRSATTPLHFSPWATRPHTTPLLFFAPRFSVHHARKTPKRSSPGP